MANIVYRTRREAKAACTYEAAAASHFSKVALECARRGECRNAWSAADNARTAAKCAMQAHEVLWELAGENMTEAEYDAFVKAETAQTDATKAEQAARAAVRQIMDEARN